MKPIKDPEFFQVPRCKTWWPSKRSWNPGLHLLKAPLLAATTTLKFLSCSLIVSSSHADEAEPGPIVAPSAPPVSAGTELDGRKVGDSTKLAPAGKASVATTGPLDEVTPLPDSLRAKFDLAPFYQKVLQIDGLPILGSSKVSDAALREAAWIVRKMLTAHPEILASLREEGGRVVVMAHDEYTTDVPEQADWKPKDHWDRRARGMGGLIGSGAEENLLCFPGDPYNTENILIHEFAHTIHGHGLKKLIPDFDRQVTRAYEKAIAAGLWKNTYASENPHEYWAEGTQSWFDNNRENDAIHNSVDTRAELKEYDPDLAALCEKVFGDGTWRYHKPMDRPAEERAHLVGYDPAKAPEFHWRDGTPGAK